MTALEHRSRRAPTAWCTAEGERLLTRAFARHLAPCKHECLVRRRFARTASGSPFSEQKAAGAARARPAVHSHLNFVARNIRSPLPYVVPCPAFRSRPALAPAGPSAPAAERRERRHRRQPRFPLGDSSASSARRGPAAVRSSALAVTRRGGRGVSFPCRGARGRIGSSRRRRRWPLDTSRALRARPAEPT